MVDKFDEVQFVYIVMDGESYGYYYKKGEMVLVDCLCYLEDYEEVILINYVVFLVEYFV